MKVAFHDFQLNYRGSSLSTYNYAKYNQEILGNESIIVSTSSRPNEMELLDRCQKLCKTILYPEVWNGQDNSHLRRALEKIVADEKIDVFYAQKGGEDDGILPTNCKTIAHYVFRGDQPHGDHYLGISEYLAKKHGRVEFLPYIVESNLGPTEDYREKLEIPKEDLMIGWLGGKTSFSLDFVRSVIFDVLYTRKDLYLFNMPNIFPTHQGGRHIQFFANTSENVKSNLINACDVMIHARRDGETFGLACAEFSAANKAVITYDGHEPWYDRAHIEMLGDKCFKYKNESELRELLLNLDVKDLRNKDWDAYTEKFNPKIVMEKFRTYL